MSTPQSSRFDFSYKNMNSQGLNIGEGEPSSTLAFVSSPSCTSSEDKEALAFTVEGCEGLYRDYLNVPVHVVKGQMEAPESKRKGPRGGVSEPFPVKLYEMLVEVERIGLDPVVSWAAHGRCFIIHKPEAFVNEIMPRYFKQSKLTSFRRQLNLYGFLRSCSQRNRGGYYHPLFLRGRPDLCKILRRQRCKGGASLRLPHQAFGKTTLGDLPSCPITRNAPRVSGDKSEPQGQEQTLVIRSSPIDCSLNEQASLQGNHIQPPSSGFLNEPSRLDGLYRHQIPRLAQETRVFKPAFDHSGSPTTFSLSNIMTEPIEEPLPPASKGNFSPEAHHHQMQQCRESIRISASRQLRDRQLGYGGPQDSDDMVGLFEGRQFQVVPHERSNPFES